MPLLSVTSNPHALTLTAVGEYPVSVERLWNAWSDPRQLERFWGPPTWPATFTRHDMQVGGRAEYFMTGPEGQVSRGYWRFRQVESPVAFEIEDGFVNEQGEDEAVGSTMVITFEATEGGARFTAVSTFPTVEAMEKLVAMGMVEGLRSALAQMDDVLADLRDFSAGRGTEVELLGEASARITRELRGSIHQIWRAHHDPDLVKQWMLGPDGWSMPVCHIPAEVGGAYRYEWESDDGTQRFGFEGEILEREAPRREKSVERMIGMPGPGNINEMTLSPRPGSRTFLAVEVTFPSAELREQILASGMVDGMEASYARLESVLG